MCDHLPQENFGVAKPHSFAVESIIFKWKEYLLMGLHNQASVDISVLYICADPGCLSCPHHGAAASWYALNSVEEGYGAGGRLLCWK